MKTSRREFLKAGCLALGVGLAVPALAIPRRTSPVWDGVVYTSTVTCPTCGTQQQLTIPSEDPLRVYHCPKCLSWLQPRQGDHCIFESYGSVPFVAIQIVRRCAQGFAI